MPSLYIIQKDEISNAHPLSLLHASLPKLLLPYQADNPKYPVLIDYSQRVYTPLKALKPPSTIIVVPTWMGVVQ